MRILLAAGVFYPDVGGPAIHVRKIAERLTEEGFEVRVVCYGLDPHNTSFGFEVSRVSRNLPKIIQWLFYFFFIIRYGLTSRLIYAFDPTAAGFPARITSLIFRKPFLMRVGGDPIWERVVEKGKRFITIDDYYEQKLYLEDRPFLFGFIKWTICGSNKLIVYNQNFKNFYNKYFGVGLDKIDIIKNPVFKREAASSDLSDTPTILFAGRLVAYKNLPKVIRAFNNLNKGNLLLIGAGPEKSNLLNLVESLKILDKVRFIDSIPQTELFEKIKESSVCIAPAISEFNPNFILESLSFGKPVLISRGHGLSVELPKYLEFDPEDEKDIEDKLKFVLDKNNYSNIVSEISKLELDQSWENVTSNHLKIIKKYL